MTDQINQFFFAQFKLTRLQTVDFSLLADQMLLRDADLFHLGVRGQFDDFQTVAQRRRNCVERVGRRDKHDLRQIVRFFQIVIGEQLVLFRIQHFQHCARWIALVIAGHLVDFVDQEHWIDDASLLHPLDDPARQRA